MPTLDTSKDRTNTAQHNTHPFFPEGDVLYEINQAIEKLKPCTNQISLQTETRVLVQRNITWIIRFDPKSP